MFSQSKSYTFFISSDGLLICNPGVIHRVTLFMLGNSALFFSSAFSALLSFQKKNFETIFQECLQDVKQLGSSQGPTFLDCYE